MKSMFFLADKGNAIYWCPLDVCVTFLGISVNNSRSACFCKQ